MLYISILPVSSLGLTLTNSSRLISIIDTNPKNSKELKAKIELIEHENKTFKYLNWHLNCDEQHYKQRSMVERVNKYLKDDFGCDKIYYQGATKVASVLAFGILSICIHKSLQLVT